MTSNYNNIEIDLKVEEMAESVKSLPRKHEDLHSTLHKK